MKKILIVEDDTSISEELKNLLDNAGYKGVILKDFENSYEEIKRENPDLILLDINIPKLNGEMLLQKIRKEYDIQVLKNPNYFDQTVYQNLPQGKMTLLGVITPDYYVYAEDLNAISWTWTEDTDTVCGYPCRKATGTYGGRTWTAWYATDIPVSFGPWKLTGLPGLILEAYDSENIHRFSAISFRKAKSAIRPLEADNALTITRDKFVKAKNHFEQDPMKNLPIEAISEMEVRKFGESVKDGSISINGVPLRLHPNGYVPLELQ